MKFKDLLFNNIKRNIPHLKDSKGRIKKIITKLSVNSDCISLHKNFSFKTTKKKELKRKIIKKNTQNLRKLFHFQKAFVSFSIIKHTHTHKSKNRKPKNKQN